MTTAPRSTRWLKRRGSGDSGGRRLGLARAVLRPHGWVVAGFAACVADPDCLDPVLAHRLDAQRVAVGLHRVAALRQPPELTEDEAADRVVGVAVYGQLEAVVEQVGDRHVTAHEPV